MNSLTHTLLTKVRGSHKDEHGFTLIELLVVIVIIGILAAIAIPMFLNQRASAAEASLKSDLRSAANEVETVSTTSGAQSKDITDGGAAASEKDSFIVDGRSYDVQTSDGTELTFSGKTGSDDAGEGFIINGTNEGTDAVWTYDSIRGGLVSQGSTSDEGEEALAENSARLWSTSGNGDYVDVSWTEVGESIKLTVTPKGGAPVPEYSNLFVGQDLSEDYVDGSYVSGSYTVSIYGIQAAQNQMIFTEYSTSTGEVVNNYEWNGSVMLWDDPFA